MKKPFYKRWLFWVIVIVVGGIIGIFNGVDEPIDQVTPSATIEPVKAVVAEATVEPTVEPIIKPTEKPLIEEKLPEVPEYEIIFDRLDKSGMWYLSFSTDATDEKALEALFEESRLLWLERKNGATSIFVDIQHPNNPAYIAQGKIAISEKGVAQTGLKKLGDSEFEIMQ